jgi:xanthine/CO dehydrogenase XdhC/CoxF family maturation factor
MYVGWISSAKRAETRMKRLAEAIGLLEQNKKLGLK